MRQPYMTIGIERIEDIYDGGDLQRPHMTPPATASQAPPAPQAPQPRANTFIDPAILSMGQMNLGPSPQTTTNPAPQSQPNSSQKRDPQPAVPPTVRINDVERQATPPTLAQEISELSAGGEILRSYGDEGDTQGSQAQISQEGGAQRKKRRPRRQPKNGGDGEASGASPVKQNQAVRGKGWRQTPILQDTKSFQPYNSLKKGHRGRPSMGQDTGWASEDVTDVQEAGDFDFESENRKFDKHTIFDQMRKHDTIDDSARLVSHNRLPRPKPGTADGKNLHYTENVLDMPSAASANASKESQAPGQDFWNSEADDGVVNSGERLSGRELGMGSRQSSRRGDSKMSATRRSQSRKASAAASVAAAPTRVNSGVRCPLGDVALRQLRRRGLC